MSTFFFESNIFESYNSNGYINYSNTIPYAKTMVKNYANGITISPLEKNVDINFHHCFSRRNCFEEFDLILDEERNEESDSIYFRPKKNMIFNVIYPKKNFLFPEIDIKLKDIFPKNFDFSKTTRSPKKLKNFQYPHYIRVVIKRRFFNTYLIKALNKITKENGYRPIFLNFGQSFAINVSKALNNKIMNMSLRQILISKESYENKKNTIYPNYKNNLELVKQIEKKRILN